MKIYDRNGTLLNIEPIETAGAVHEVELMKSDLVCLSWVSEECVTIPAGSYIIPFDDDDEQRYTLYEDYIPEEMSTGFKYEPQFESPVMWLGYVPFTFKTKDAAGADIKKTDYPYVGRLDEILTHYMNLVNGEFSKRWQEQYGETFDGFQIGYYIGFDKTKTVSVTFSENDCLSALALICEAAGCEFHFDWNERQLYIGDKINETPVGNEHIYVIPGDDKRWLDLEIGDNVNEPSISRSKNPVYNRYIVLGSERNNIRETKDAQGHGTGRFIATGERLTLDMGVYPDSIMDMRHRADEPNPYSPNNGWKDGMSNVPATTGIMTIDDIYPHRDLYIYNLVERKKYKLDENGYPTSERWSVWYFKLAYLQGGQWNDFKLIGDGSTNLTCRIISTETSDGKTVGYVTSLSWGDYFKTLTDTENEKRTQKYAIVLISGSYHVGVKNHNGKVMLCSYNQGFNAPTGRNDRFDDIVEGGLIHINDTLSLVDVDLSKAPSENRADYRVDGLVPTIAFRVNEENGAKMSPLGTREFEVEYHTEPIDFDLDDDVPGQTGISEGGYYEIIHTEEGDGLIMPTTSDQGICPMVSSNSQSVLNNKCFLFNIQPDESMVITARQELQNEAVKAIKDLAVDNNTYTFQCNPVALEEDLSNDYRYVVGIRTRFVLGNGYEYFGRILSVKTKLDYSFCKEITVGNAVQKGRNDRIISELKKQSATIGKGGIGATESGTGTVNPSDIARFGKDYFISKTEEDETEYLVSFLGGLMVDGFLKSPQYSEGEWEKVKDTETGLWTKVHSGEGLGVYEDRDGSWHIELDYATIRKMLQTKELESLKAYFGSEDYYNPEESVLSVNGNAEFSHHLSSPEFQSGFLSGKGWAIKRVEFTNSLGEPETRYTLEIDNLTVRNILRVYELVVSQLRGENDNYVFAAMAEVDHYDPVSGRVWISTEGGKIYNPFRVGDYIMVQRFQPGNDVVSGGDGYITKQYELIILAVGSGGENDPKDANGDRLDWVLFKNFTSQMLTWDFVSSNYSEEELASTIDRINRDYPNATQARKRDLIVEALKIPDMMIRKGDTFCRVDNETDPERKGLMTITSVGPNTPYMDVIYGMKTDPDHSLKSRLGNLEGVKTDLFGWLEGFGAYINNLYGVGKFFNAQTGEAMESRIEATNERMRSVYKETTFDITDADNKVSNGFFQDDLDGWTPVKVSDNGTVTADDDGPEMNYSNSTQKWSMSNTDQNNQIAVASGESTTVDGQEYQLPLLMNGLQMEIQKTLKSEISEVGGMKVLHLAKSGVIQNFSLMDENTSHKKLSVDDEDFEAADVQMVTNKEYEKTSYAYWEQYYRDWLFENWERLYPGVTYEKCKVDEIITSQTAVTWINDQVAIWSASYSNNYDNLTSTEADPDKLYLGIRIMPLTDGWLRIGFLTESGKFDQYQNATQCFSKYFSGAGSTMKWEVATWNDDPTDGTFWYFPCDSDKVTKRGRLLISYTGECYIRFVVLSNDPIEESEHEYETLIEQNARRIRMQAKKDEKEFAEIVIQHNAIVQSITDNRDVADHALKDILGIEYNEKTGMYTFPNDWFDPSYTYGSWLIHTKSRIDFLFTKFDDKGNLIGYSNHTQTADYISDIIASGDGYPTWAVNCMNFAKAFLRFSNTYYENSNLKYGVWLTAIADSALSSSELTTIKALFQSNGDIQQKYTAAANKVSEIPSDIGDLGDDKKISDPMGRSLIVTFFNRVIATRYSTVKSSVNSLSADGGSNVNMNNSTFLSLRNMEIPQMEEACRELVAMIVNRYGEQKLGANIQIVQEGFKAYQDSLDDAIKDAYAGQNVDFVSWASDTALSSVQAKAIIDKDTGKIKTESIKTQTAELIQNAINNYGGGKFSDYSQTDNGFQSFVVCLKNDRINFANFETAQGNVRSYLEDNILNKSEYEAIKKLRMSLVTEYTDITATYTHIHGNSNLPGDDNNQGSVKGKIKKAYDDLSRAYTTLLSSIDTLITDYDSALQTNTSGNIEIKVSDTKKNAVNNNFATFNTKLTDYQKALDEASNEINKATAQGLVNQLKEIINTDVLADDQGNYAYAGFTQTEANRLANIFGKWEVDSNGNPTYLKGYSTTQQTADMISASVISQNRKTVSLADTSVWEQGSTDGESAGKTYEQVKITSNNRIRTKSLIPVTKDTVIELTGSSFMVGFVCFGLDMKISSDAWKGWYSYNSANLTLKNTISDSTKYVAILLRYTNSASISASNVTSSGIKLTNTEVISSSEVQQTAENITTTVTNNKTAAETAFKTLFADSSFSLDGSNIASKVSASWIMQNKSGISFAASEFDSSGNLKSSGKIKVAVDGVLTTVKDYKTNGYSILTQTADAIKSVVTGNYIGDKISISDYAKNSDLPDMSKYYSKTQIDQLASSITSRVTGLERQVIDLNNIDNWEQGFINNTAGSTYDNLKQDNANFIRTKALLGISQDTVFTISDSFVMMLAFFNYSRNLISRTVALTKTGDVIAPQIPSNATYCAITISKSGYATSVLDLPSAKLFKIDSSVVTSAEISAFVKKTSDGYLESGIKLKADQIDFHFTKSMNAYNKDNIAVAGIDNDGNLWVNGTVNGVVIGDVTGTVHTNLQYGKVIYVNSGDYSIDLNTNPAKTFVDASSSSYAANVYLPKASSYDGVELQFFTERPTTRIPSHAGMKLLTVSNDTIVCQDNTESFVKQVQVTSYWIKIGALVTLKSMIGKWWVVTGDYEP